MNKKVNLLPGLKERVWAPETKFMSKCIGNLWNDK